VNETRRTRIDWVEVRAKLQENERLLARALHPDGEVRRTVRRRRMLELARRGAPTKRAAPIASMLVGMVCDERYGFDLAELSHVGLLSNFTPIFSDVPAVLGVSAWRGDVRTVICLRAMLGLEPPPIAKIGDHTLFPRRLSNQVALRVDGIDRIVQVSDAIPGPGDADWVHTNPHIRGRTVDGVAMVDLNSLLGDPLVSIPSGGFDSRMEGDGTTAGDPRDPPGTPAPGLSGSSA